MAADKPESNRRNQRSVGIRGHVSKSPIAEKLSARRICALRGTLIRRASCASSFRRWVFAHLPRHLAKRGLTVLSFSRENWYFWFSITTAPYEANRKATTVTNGPRASCMCFVKGHESKTSAAITTKNTVPAGEKKIMKS